MILKKRLYSLFYRWATTTYDIYYNVMDLDRYDAMQYSRTDDIYGLEADAEIFLRTIKPFKKYKVFGREMPGVVFTPAFAQYHDNTFRFIVCQGVSWFGPSPPMVLFHRKLDAIRFIVRYGRLRDPAYRPD